MSTDCNAKFPVHYRYKDGVSPQGLLLIEQTFYPIKETPCFYFVLPEWSYNLYMRGIGDYGKQARRVSKNGVRRYCYPSREQAFESYKIRKNKQLWHAQNAINVATLAVNSLKGINTPEALNVVPEYTRCKLIGHASFIDEYIFE